MVQTFQQPLDSCANGLVFFHRLKGVELAIFFEV